MFNLNKVILIGNLGADPEIKHFEGDKMLANVRIATTESYRDKNNIKHEVTEWHDVELWDNLAKVVAQYVRKGDTIYIEGKIKSDTWTDEQGNNRKKVKIRATQMNLVRTAGSSGNTTTSSTTSPSAKGAKSSQNPSLPPIEEISQQDDDLPF